MVTIFDSQLASQEGPLKLMADSVCERMDRLLKEFSCSTVYQQWNMTVDEIVGMFNIETDLLSQKDIGYLVLTHQISIVELH